MTAMNTKSTLFLALLLASGAAQAAPVHEVRIPEKYRAPDGVGVEVKPAKVTLTQKADALGRTAAELAHDVPRALGKSLVATVRAPGAWRRVSKSATSVE